MTINGWFTSTNISLSIFVRTLSRTEGKKEKKTSMKQMYLVLIQMEQKWAYGKALLSKKPFPLLPYLFLIFKPPTKHMLSDSKTLFYFLPAPASFTSTYFFPQHIPVFCDKPYYFLERNSHLHLQAANFNLWINYLHWRDFLSFKITFSSSTTNSSYLHTVELHPL